MSLNAVNTLQSEIVDLTNLAEKIGRMHNMPNWEVDPSQFKHIITSRDALITTSGDSQVLLYTVPPGMDFIMTYINLRALVVTGSTPSAFDELFGFFGGAATGNVFNARLRKNGTDLTMTGVTYQALANRPVLFVFTAGDVVGLIVNVSGIVSGGVNIPGSISGFEVPTGMMIAPRLAGMQTRITNPNTIYNNTPGGASLGITVTNTAF